MSVHGFNAPFQNYCQPNGAKNILKIYKINITLEGKEGTVYLCSNKNWTHEHTKGQMSLAKFS